MVALDRALHEYAASRLAKEAPHDRTLAITVSGPQCVGEGEAKMLAHFYSLARSAVGPSTRGGGGSSGGGSDSRSGVPQKHGLIGTDSDLLLMALASGVVASPGSGAVRGVDAAFHDLTVRPDGEEHVSSAAPINPPTPPSLVHPQFSLAPFSAPPPSNRSSS
jgi:hypothetical protein